MPIMLFLTNLGTNASLLSYKLNLELKGKVIKECFDLSEAKTAHALKSG
jgi:hypothetical protein